MDLVKCDFFDSNVNLLVTRDNFKGKNSFTRGAILRTRGHLPPILYVTKSPEVAGFGLPSTLLLAICGKIDADSLTIIDPYRYTSA